MQYDRRPTATGSPSASSTARRRAPAAARRRRRPRHAGVVRFLPGLVVGDAQRARRRASLDRSTEPRSRKRPSTDATGSLRGSRGVAGPRRRAARSELEVAPGSHSLPSAVRRSRPDAQVRRDVVDLVVPHALDRRRELSRGIGGHAVDDRVERRAARVRVGVRSTAAAARPLCSARKNSACTSWNRLPRVERIERCSGCRLLGGLEPIDRGEQELVRAGREPLQRRERVRPRRQALRGERRLRSCPVTRTSPSDGVHCALPPRPRARDRSAQRRRSAEQVVRAAAHRARMSVGLQSGAQDREVVLEIVDRARGLPRRRPRQPAPPSAAARAASSSWSGMRPVIARMTSSA